MSPIDPIAAATHADPYGFYAALAATTALHRDESHGLWVAASAAAVEAVLTSPSCRVRPANVPVPPALAGTAAGRIFGALVRMNDGAAHCPLKRAIAAACGRIDRARAASVGGREAAALVPRTPLEAFAFVLPAHVVAALLGVPADMRPDIARWTADFAAAIGATASPDETARGIDAARHLLDAVHALLRAPADLPPDALLAALAREARHAGRVEPDIIAANAIGLLSQTYDATAGLIGNTLLAFAAHPAAGAEARTDDRALTAFIDEVQRWDPPIQNTRRFAAADATIAGTAVREGDAILVLLAAANRDPAANPDPARFDPARADRRSFTFGHGAHACPGRTLALVIAASAVRALLARGLDPATLVRPARYRRSANARIPLLATRDACP